MAMASDHMNTKVSAYIAFLSAMRAEIPATERLTLGVSGVTDNTPTVYLDANGKVVPEFLRTLVFARPRGDDQFADCTFSPSLDMSR